MSRLQRSMTAVTEDLKGRSYTKVADWTRAELEKVLDLADTLKRAQKAQEEHRLLPGRTIGLIFDPGELHVGRTETVRDTAGVLSRYLDALVVRTFAQSDVEDYAANMSIP